MAEAYSPAGLLWTGPDSTGPQGGLTFSLLCRFIVCPERFFLNISGQRERPRFDPALEFGSLFQLAMEDDALLTAHNRGAIGLLALDEYRGVLLRRYPADEDADLIDLWTQMAKVVAKAYRAHWAEEDKGRVQIAYENEFNVKYVPSWPAGSGSFFEPPVICLRGKMDGVLAVKGPTVVQSGRKRQLYHEYVEENKTKSQIDEEGLLGTVAENLQTMIYLIAYGKLYNKTPAGIIYNVVRRPGIKPDKRKGETVPLFLERLEERILKEPDHYFKRWRAAVSPELLNRYRRRTIDPLLYRLWTWWEDVARFCAEGEHERRWETPLHYQAPWGVYNSLAAGFRGDYFDHLTKGAPLSRFDNLFPELSDPNPA